MMCQSRWRWLPIMPPPCVMPCTNTNDLSLAASVRKKRNSSSSLALPSCSGRTRQIGQVEPRRVHHRHVDGHVEIGAARHAVAELQLVVGQRLDQRRIGLAGHVAVEDVLHLRHAERPARVGPVEIRLLAAALDLGRVLARVGEGVQDRAARRAWARQPRTRRRGWRPRTPRTSARTACPSPARRPAGRPSGRRRRSGCPSCRRCARRSRSPRGPWSTRRSRGRRSDPWPSSRCGPARRGRSCRGWRRSSRAPGTARAWPLPAARLALAIEIELHRALHGPVLLRLDLRLLGRGGRRGKAGGQDARRGRRGGFDEVAPVESCAARVPGWWLHGETRNVASRS